MISDPSIVDVSQDWALACDVQQRFMQGLDPAVEKVADALDYSAHCRQVHALGGDCYDFVALPDHRLALAIGDASGKGLAAALMMSNVQSSLRTAALFTGNDASAALTAVNRQVYASSLANRYATLFYGVFDVAARTLKYVNAGHNPPMVMRRDGSVAWLETGGAPVGMFEDWPYKEAVIQLSPGDLMVAFTDGVTEAVNPAGEEWGVDGILRVTAESAGQDADAVVRAILASLDEFSRGRQADDATVVALRVR
jgi:sigma-B regulation protein RsbU (phosphoserine phosphatase)